jgi:hypothetical protein
MPSINDREEERLHLGCQTWPNQICSAQRLERILVAFPNLQIYVPHMGLDELDAYRNQVEAYDNLWLDTTMVLTDYLLLAETVDLRDYRLDCIMYGSDFPNIPSAWDRALHYLGRGGLDAAMLGKILWQHAACFYGF